VSLEHDLEATLSRIRPADAAAAAAAQDAFDQKTKPPRSLGRLEDVVCRIAALRGRAALEPLQAAIVVAAGDHGVAVEGVSAYPQAVTAEMLRTFVRGRAAVEVLARRAGARLVIVDAGTCTFVDDPRIRRLRIGRGTADFVYGPAMTRTQAQTAIAAGIDLAEELADDGIGLIATGEMGIGNTTAASALAAALLPADPAAVCGRGTGLDVAGVARKISVVRRALHVNRVDADDPIGTLAALGGYEIAFLSGLVLGAAAERVVIVLDGFITGAAALVAVRLAPHTRAAMIAAHVSPEPGHRPVLAALSLEPLLELDLRLGEGSGAALALPLIQSSLALADEMATFAESGVSGAGA
jgi:nicotinate-nucleotide--dimethylbenzimidazole phosphoribosyltransferase